MKAWETALLRFIDTGFPEIAKDISDSGRLTPEIENKLGNAIQAFVASWRQSE